MGSDQKEIERTWMAYSRFTPLGPLTPDGLVSGLLEFEGCTLLLDCGWDEGFDPSALESIARVAASIDAVLVSHHDVQHLGALPYLVSRCGLTAPILGTLPVQRMGALTLREAVNSKRACSDFNSLSLEDIQAGFDPQRWTLLRYYQRLELPGRGSGIVVTPYNSGHLVGGAVWRIVGRGGEEVVYAVDWCHKRERHLAACNMFDLFTRPALLLMDATDALSAPVDSAKRDAELIDTIVATVRGADGSVLIPVDAAGRALELALLLDSIWAREKYGRIYPLVWISDVSRQVAEAAQSQLEWMAESVGKAFELHRANPFNFRCLHLLSSVAQLDQLQPGPKVVLATHPSLEYGPARELLVRWAGTPTNTLCFVQRPPAGTLGDRLLRHIQGDDPLTLPVSHTKRVRLEGAELEEWEARHLMAGVEEQEGAPDAVMAGDGGAAVKQEGGPPSVTGVGVPPLIPPALQGSGGSGSTPGAHASGTGTAPGAPPTPRSAAHSRHHPAPHGLMPLRTSSAHISTLVRDTASGLMVQQLHGGAPGGTGGGAMSGTKAGGSGKEIVLAPQASASQGQGQLSYTAPMLTDVLIDGFVPPQGSAYPMFPDEDEGPLQEVWDEYGVKIDHEEFRAALRASGSLISSGGGGGAAGPSRARKRIVGPADDDDDEEDRGRAPSVERDDLVVEGEGGEDEDDDERPTKLVTEQVELVMRAAVRYFNYEGRADARILRKALADVAPRVMVLLHGSSGARAELCVHAGRELQGLGARVLLPKQGEEVDVSVPPSHTLAISDELHATAVPHRLGGSSYSVALVEGVVSHPDPHHPSYLQIIPPVRGLSTASSGEAALQSQSQSQAMQVDGGDEKLLHHAQQDHHPQHQWLGDVFFAQGAEGIMLSQVKKALADAGIQSTWLGPGALSCGPVVISKASVYSTITGGPGNLLATGAGAGGGAGAGDAQAGKGHLILEAALSEQHEELLQRVRAVIYTQFSAAT